MGHVGLLVQEQGFDLSRAIRTLDCAWGWEGGGVLDWTLHPREERVPNAWSLPPCHNFCQ